MAVTQLHPKIKAAKAAARPINYRAAMAVNADGSLVAATVTDRTVKGYLVTWGNKNSFDEIFIKGAFAKSIQEHGPNSTSPQKIAFLWAHDTAEPLGRFTVLEEREIGLYFEADVDETEEGDTFLIRFRNGTVNQFSIGFNYVWNAVEWDNNLEALIVREAVLFEGSAVTIGSDSFTHGIRSYDNLDEEIEQSTEDLHDFLRKLPKSKQLEARAIITRHLALLDRKPHQAAAEALKQQPQTVDDLAASLLNNNNWF